MSYYTRLKIERAKELLRGGNMTVSQISELLSFNAPDYFSKTFRKFTRMTPSKYRKLHGSSAAKD